MKMQKPVIFVKTKLKINIWTAKSFVKCHKVRDNCNYTGKYRGGAHII